VQVEVDVSGLPTEDPSAVYFAQVHEGSCSDERSGEGHEEHSAVAGPTLALVKFDRLLAKGGTLLAKATGHRRTVAMRPTSPRCRPAASSNR
jgi:hypothetical protein